MACFLAIAFFVVACLTPATAGELLRCRSTDAIGAQDDGTLAKRATDELWLKRYQDFTVDTDTGLMRSPDANPITWVVVSRSRKETILIDSNEQLRDAALSSMAIAEESAGQMVFKVHIAYRLIVGRCERIN